VAIHDGRVTFGYGIHVPGFANTDQIYDLAVAAIANVMRQLCGTGWRPESYLLPRRRPADIRPYRQHFAAPLRFDSIIAAVVFPEAHLSQAIADADPLLTGCCPRTPLQPLPRRIRLCTRTSGGRSGSC